jgi:hypothetical protein
VLTTRLLAAVKTTVESLQVTLDAAMRPRLITLSRNVFRLIVLQSIGRSKFTVTVVLMGTLVASSAGLVETTIGREAAAVPTIATIINKAARESPLTMFLTIDVIFLVANMTFISLFTCILMELEVLRGIVN